MSRKIHPETRRSLIVLAALRLKTADLIRLDRYLRALSPEQFVNIIKNLEAEHIDMEEQEREENSPDLLARSTDDAVVDQAISLLRREARLDNRAIVEALHRELSWGDPPIGSAPNYDPRKSIANWLIQVSRAVGPSQLLRAATKVRNKVVHQGARPWSLERKDG